MKRILLAGAAFAALTSASYAADLSAPIEEVDTWSGFYAGIQGGFAQGDLDAFNDTLGIGYTSEIEGGFGGLYWGKNWQFNSWVLGLDGSISFAAIEDQNDLPASDIDPDVEIEAFSASRVRIGYAFDNLMIFAAGGFSIARTNVDDGLSDDETYLKGFTVGAGLDYKFSENFSARLEYMYFNYEEEQRTIFDGSGDTFLINVEDVHAVRAGIAYHF